MRETAGVSTQSAETSETRTSGKCGLDGCDEPLPPRPLDELGRPKGGRRARYCSKAHADAASRQRRASDLAAVADPLALAREATAGVLPVARQLGEQLTSLVARFEQAENGALARVQAAETEAEQAHAEAARAAESEQQAEHARREALAAARRDREEKDQALHRAEQAQAEAQQVRDDAWKQIAEHERARGQAEAELATVRTALETLRREHATLLDTAQDQRTRITALDLQLATTAVELRQAGDRVTDLTTRLDHTQQQNERRHQENQARHEDQLRTLTERHETEMARIRKHLEATTQAMHASNTTAKQTANVTAKPARRRPRIAGNRPTDRTRPQT